MIASMVMQSMEALIDENKTESESIDEWARSANEVLDKAKEMSEELLRKVTIEELCKEYDLDPEFVKNVCEVTGNAIEFIEIKESKMTQNRDFKYVVQDTSHAYLGAKMTFAELIEYDDVPFKIKSIVMKYAVPLVGEKGTFVDFFGKITEDSFEFQVVKQLRVKVKAGIYETKVKRGKEIRITAAKTERKNLIPLPI